MSTRRPTVLVTGAGGFIGRALVDRLGESHDVVALDRSAPAQPAACAEFVGMDIGCDDSVRAALERVRAAHGTRIASVIDLAAYFDLSGEPDPRYDTVTVEGTQRLIRALRTLHVEQFVFMSTMLVHAASGHDARIDEDSPLDRRFPYRASKIRAEAMLRDEHADIPLVLLRPAGVYDELCHAAFLSHQIARIHQRRLTSHVYPGDLLAGQPYLHLDDLIDALLRVVERRHALPPEAALLLAETDVMSFGEIQQRVGLLLHGEQWQTSTIPKSVASTGAWLQDRLLDEDPFIKPWMVEVSSDHYRVDIRRATRLLGWKPTHTLRRSLPDIVAALRADPLGWYDANGLNVATVAAEAAEKAQREARQQDAQDPSDAAADAPDAPDAPDASDAHGHHDMAAQMRAAHFKLLWVHWLNILLGAWLVSSPVVFGSFDAHGFSDAVLRVTAERGLMDPALRSLLLARSDVVSGLLIMGFGALSLSPRLSWAQWANAAIGCWLLFAPLLFWAPSAAVYANDTFVGALVIAFAILVPMMPGMSMAGMMDESDLPPGWSYSPSTYLQRLPIVALGAFGFLIARWLAAYQLGHVDGVWEPFFAGTTPSLNGTESIITSEVSKAWPVADAGLGGMAYLFEVLMGVMGDRRRWRTMPWMVAMFGIVVVPLGVVSIYFIVIQPVVIGTWCTLCLVTAVAMLAMIPLSLDELVAMGQFLVQSRSRGEPFWRTFFTGGAQPATGRVATDHHAGFDASFAAAFASAVRGVNLPWTLVCCALLGAALMFTRVFFDSAPPLADSDHVVGAMIVTFAVMAMAEVARPLRFVNIALGLWLVAAPWLLAGAGGVGTAFDVGVGVLVVALSLPRGKRSAQHYGRWDRFVA